MSNAEYVAKLDEDQLENLIEQASARIKAIRQTGWVPLWTVSISACNVGWFAVEDYAAAVEFACMEVKKEAQRSPGYGVEMAVDTFRYRPEEVAALLTHKRNCVAAAPTTETVKEMP